MRNKILAIVLTLIMLLCMAACGGTTNEETTENTTEASAEIPTEAPTEEPIEEPTTPPATEIFLNEEFTVEDFGTFTFTGYDTTTKITRNGMQKLGKYTTSEEGCVLILVYANYKNLQPEEISATKIVKNAKLTYQDTYSYDGGSLSWEDALPLADIEIMLSFNVPVEVAESGESLKIAFTINGQEYVHTIESLA